MDKVELKQRMGTMPKIADADIRGSRLQLEGPSGSQGMHATKGFFQASRQEHGDEADRAELKEREWLR